MKSFERLSPYILIVGPSVLLLAIVVWAFVDARKRARSGILVGLLVAGTFPLGVLLWMAARPDIASGDAVPENADPDRELKERANAGLL